MAISMAPCSNPFGVFLSGFTAKLGEIVSLLSESERPQPESVRSTSQCCVYLSWDDSGNFTPWAVLRLEMAMTGILFGWWFGTWILCFHILGIIIPTDELILFRGVESTNQLCCISILAMNREWTWTSHYLEHCLMVVEEFDQRNYHVAWRWLMSSRDCRAIFWRRSAQLLKHSQQIAIFDALICWYLSNVVSWLVARFAIVAIIFQIIPNPCIVWKVHYCGNIIWFHMQACHSTECVIF